MVVIEGTVLVLKKKNAPGVYSLIIQKTIVERFFTAYNFHSFIHSFKELSLTFIQSFIFISSIHKASWWTI